MIKRKFIVNIVAFCFGLFFVFATAGHLFAQPPQPTRLPATPPNRSAIRFQQSALQPPTEAQGNCSRCQTDLVTLLVPIDDRTQNCSPRFSLTVQEHPSFYIYIKKLAALKEQIADTPPNFFISDNRSQTILYEAQFSLPTESGIFKIDLPSSMKLEVGKPYVWSLEFEDKVGIIGTIEGWIERIEMSPQLSRELTATTNPIERARLYANAGIWYDALDTLMQARQNADSQELKDQWVSLLNSIDVNDIEDASIVAVDVNDADPNRTTIPAGARSVKCL
jgi:hypothetical protein